MLTFFARDPQHVVEISGAPKGGPLGGVYAMWCGSGPDPERVVSLMDRRPPTCTNSKGYGIGYP